MYAIVCSVKIELMKRREYAGKVARVCNWALTGVGASLNGVASVCNVVCSMSAKSDGRLLKRKEVL